MYVLLAVVKLKMNDLLILIPELKHGPVINILIQ